LAEFELKHARVRTNGFTVYVMEPELRSLELNQRTPVCVAWRIFFAHMTFDLKTKFEGLIGIHRPKVSTYVHLNCDSCWLDNFVSNPVDKLSSLEAFTAYYWSVYEF
jgi:hypothetical protein